MRKRMSFDQHYGKGWPNPEELKSYFIAPPGQEWFNTGGNDSGGFDIKGMYGTENGVEYETRVDADLSLYGVPGLGVMLLYNKYGGGYREHYSSKGDLKRLKEYVRSLHGDPMPVGLFIPFHRAYEAVKEFIETDGELPKCIDWIADEDLPPGTFPDPAAELARRFAEE